MNLISTSHTIKDVSVLSENRLDLVHKEVNIRTKLICKVFSDNLEDDIEKTYGPEFIV